MKKTRKFIALIILAVMLLMTFTGTAQAASTTIEPFTDEEIVTLINEKKLSDTSFSPMNLLRVYVRDDVIDDAALTEELKKKLSDASLPKLSADDLEAKGIIKLSDKINNGNIDVDDPTFLLALYSQIYTSSSEAPNTHVNTLQEGVLAKNNIGKDNIEIRTTLEFPDTILNKYEGLSSYKVFGEKGNKYTISSKTATEAEIGKIHDAIEQLSKKIGEDNSYSDALAILIEQVQVVAIVESEKITYTLTLGSDQNWYLVPDKVLTPAQPDKKEEFSTTLSYTAVIDGKTITGELKDGTYYPGFDEKQPEKDADVTAYIKSNNDLPILETDGVALTTDGKPNSKGWYYVDVNDKTVIAKIYPFDDYDNLNDNGMVKEKVVLTSTDGLKDDQTVSIKWPFRIIKETQDPETITEETKKVIVTITTNLPMDEKKLPEGWKFTTDDEGKTQHRIEKEYTRDGGNVNEPVIVTAHGRTDTDSTKVKITWPEKLPLKHPQTGGTLTIAILAVFALGFCVVTYRKFRK